MTLCCSRAIYYYPDTTAYYEWSGDYPSEAYLKKLSTIPADNTSEEAVPKDLSDTPPDNRHIRDNSKTDKPPRKTYVTRDERRQFIKWYLDNYGHNTNMKCHSAEKLSAEYKTRTGIYIPKISIHRWTHHMKNNELSDYASMYIEESLK